MRAMTYCVLVGCIALVGADAPDRVGQTIANHFEKGDEGWHIYDYNGGSGNQDKFNSVTWEKSGGVKDGGYLWGDEGRCRIDTPRSRIPSWPSSTTGAGSRGSRSTCVTPRSRSTSAATSSISRA